MRLQVPHMGDTASILFTDWRVHTGGKVRGQLSAPRMSRTADFGEPRRIFITGRKSRAKPGTVLLGTDRRRYLLMANGLEDRNGIDYKTFKALELTETLDLYRKVETFDPVTQRTLGMQDELVSASVWAYVEDLRARLDAPGVSTNRFRITTYYPIQAGDTFGGYRILRVDESLGVFVAEAD